MKTIFLVPIEPIDSRYTKQWYENIPKIIKNRISELSLDPHEVVTIDGEGANNATTTGAFLDFATTNYYKAAQVQAISELFMHGRVKPGDKFLVTDAWNFAITAIRYMSDLLEIPVEIHGIWHAGHYDPTDILGMKMQKSWPPHQERAWFHACDYNWYATNFHRSMFLTNLDIDYKSAYKAQRSGQPHELLIDQLEPLQAKEKAPVVIWPHRYNADKQPEIAEDLKDTFDITITAKMGLTKQQYYGVLGRSQVIFSCALHENLGISIMEAVLAGSIPVLPDRCSYAEMYPKEFLYPSVWTSNYENYQNYKPQLVEFIQDRVYHPEKYAKALELAQDIIKDHYLNCNKMLDALLDINTVQP
jgi:hypothetical protein